METYRVRPIRQSCGVKTIVSMKVETPKMKLLPDCHILLCGSWKRRSGTVWGIIGGGIVESVDQPSCFKWILTYPFIDMSLHLHWILSFRLCKSCTWFFWCEIMTRQERATRPLNWLLWPRSFWRCLTWLVVSLSTRSPTIVYCRPCVLTQTLWRECLPDGPTCGDN